MVMMAMALSLSLLSRTRVLIVNSDQLPQPAIGTESITRRAMRSR